MPESAIAIDGLAAFNKALKKLDADLPKALRIAIKEAADMVAADIRPKVPSRTGRARRSIKAKATRTQARVEAWGDRVLYGKWLDWGGAVGRRHATKRTFIKGDGRYVYKSYADLKASGAIQAKLQESLVRVAEQAGLEVK